MKSLSKVWITVWKGVKCFDTYTHPAQNAIMMMVGAAIIGVAYNVAMGQVSWWEVRTNLTNLDSGDDREWLCSRVQSLSSEEEEILSAICNK